MCGASASSGDYCDAHQVEAEVARNRRRVHYQGDYAKRAAKVRAEATRCALCGKGPRRGDPWTAHHVRPGDPDSPLTAAHRSCNSSLGDRVGD